MAVKREAYLCLSAMLRAREPKLLNNDRAQRMLDASGFQECAKLLTDCGYEDMSDMSAKEIEQSLAAYRAKIFAELENLAPEKEIVDVFKIKYDYHNAKAIIKAEAMGQSAGSLLSDAGRIPGDKLLGLYNEERYSELPGKLGSAVSEAKGILARTSNPQLADIALDKAYFAELKAIAAVVNSSFLAGYVKLLIDAANLKSAVRTLRMKKGDDFMVTVLIPGGNVDESRIIAAADAEGITALYDKGKLEKAAALGLAAVSGGSMTAFELACDNAVNSYLCDAKLISYGSEALMAYLAAVEGEITAVRMILTGRLAGIAPQVIRERLRDLYA